MAKQAGQKRKLLYLLEILREESDEEHPLSTKALLEKLAARGITAERKSIYSDMEELAAHGYDILSVPSRNGGGYYLGQREFELAELKLLVDAVAASRFIPTGKSRTLIRKMEQMSSKYDAGKLQRQVVVAGRAKTENERIYYSIDEIHNAMQENRQISFVYLDWNEKKELVPRDDKLRAVSPWALVWKDENYYLLAYDDESAILKHYRVDKMSQVKKKDAQRMGRTVFEKINLAAYVNRNFGMFGGEEEIVTMRFEKRLLGVIMDCFGKDVTIRQDEKEGYLTVRTSIHVSGQFFGWLCGLGTGIQIVEPRKVAQTYKDWLKEILA